MSIALFEFLICQNLQASRYAAARDLVVVVVVVANPLPPLPSPDTVPVSRLLPCYRLDPSWFFLPLLRKPPFDGGSLSCRLFCGIA